jgi:lipoprotein-anchoring transpeptidase ErfK/SrfK
MPQEPNSSNAKQKDISRFELIIADSKRRFSNISEPNNKQTILIVSIADQQLLLIENHEISKNYSISSAEAGTGNQSGSYQTPLGAHQVSEKFGEDAVISSIFKARKNTHTLAEILNNPNEKSPEDNITSRIFWLDGLEQGHNKGSDKQGNNVDSRSRYIYIHGTDEEGRLGQRASHGCIRMANQDIIELFELVKIGCLVIITEG